MLIRLIIDNFLSFGEEREFNMLPNERYRKLEHHTYPVGNQSVLKLAAIYGANAAGKSNLVKALSFLSYLTYNESIPARPGGWHFKLDEEGRHRPTTLAIEFQAETNAFIYAIQVVNGTLTAEELYVSSLGDGEDRLIFERSVVDGRVSIRFGEAFYQDDKNRVLQDLLENNLLVPDKPALRYLTTLKVARLPELQEAADWLLQGLKVIAPDDPARAMAYFLSRDPAMYRYADQMIKAYNLGIDGIHLARTPLKEFFGRDATQQIDEIKEHLAKAGTGIITLSNEGGNEYTIVEESDEIFVQHLLTKHATAAGKERLFTLDQESDGSRRLVHLIPIFQEVVQKPVVYFIDEIERSLHPAIIKELIAKFSEDPKTQGQLIFTTHESNLLDQSILRRDEIWFAEKNSLGSTDLYSLSKFREHHTMDIQRGYLNGRYGAIPFTGNLEELNWHEYDPV
ncbi:AAA family ATPase [Lewinella sp. IMCC34183]|uniref:AAA family ATPase n=1 Tax=Lewinella sp. IMCC34183 TaxID=2248762 RepID=UPI000E231A6D|nr:ATP-binding protein [Lewinella sp. IMCC34183]